MRFGFCSGANEHPMAIVGSERCVNWVPEQGKEGLTYIQRPGLLKLADVGPGPWRACIEQNGQAFYVGGGSLYEIFENGTGNLLGTFGQLGNDGLPASMALNGRGRQLCVISNEDGFIYDLDTNMLTEITDPQFPTNPLMVVFMNGHFAVIAKDDTLWYLSEQFDGTSWASADIGEKSKTPDYFKALIISDDSNELRLIGEQTTELWRYTGAAGFPMDFATVVPVGTVASFSWAALGGNVYGLAQAKEGGRVFVKLAGYSYERISTHAIERTVQGYSESDIANCQGFAFEIGGHRFVLFSFVGARKTFVYDEATALWSEWDHWNSMAMQSEAFVGLGHMFAFGKHLMGSHLDGAMNEVSFAYKDDNGSTIRRVAQGPRIAAEGKRVMHHALRQDVQVIVANDDTDAPVAVWQWSEDLGRTWSAEQEISLGVQGVDDDPAELRQLGLAGFKGRIYRQIITDPLIAAIGDVFLDLGAAA